MNQFLGWLILNVLKLIGLLIWIIKGLVKIILIILSPLIGLMTGLIWPIYNALRKPDNLNRTTKVNNQGGDTSVNLKSESNGLKSQEQAKELPSIKWRKCTVCNKTYKSWNLNFCSKECTFEFVCNPDKYFNSRLAELENAVSAEEFKVKLSKQFEGNFPWRKFEHTDGGNKGYNWKCTSDFNCINQKDKILSLQKTGVIPLVDSQKKIKRIYCLAFIIEKNLDVFIVFANKNIIKKDYFELTDFDFFNHRVIQIKTIEEGFTVAKEEINTIYESTKDVFIEKYANTWCQETTK